VSSGARSRCLASVQGPDVTSTFGLIGSSPLGDLAHSGDKRADERIRCGRRARGLAHQIPDRCSRTKDGLVDADYVAKSGDRRYTIGQRLVVTPAEVRRLAHLTEKLSLALAAAG
jgi:hypothetical protein